MNQLKHCIACIFLIAYSCCFPQLLCGQQQIAKGLVYADLNANGKKDRQEKGLPNVGVSNGRDVVLTDKNGQYSLTLKPTDILFVIKPAGYRTALTATNLPAFYYSYNPSGSPTQKYPGIAPTGKLPESLDFGLVPQEESKSFRMMVFGDPQTLDDKELDYFNRGILDEIVGAEKDVAFGLTMGDMAYDDLTILPKYIEKIQRLGLPWYHTGGNHDINFDAASDEFGSETFKALFGPITFSFNYADVHFIVVNNVVYKGGSYEAKGEYQGGFRKSQLEFIENDLKQVPKDKLVVLISHIPYVGREGNPTIRKKDLDQLFTLLKDYKHTFSVAAHTHTQGQRFVKAPYLKNTAIPYHHQYNIGTTSGNLYSGVPDERTGIPPSTMADGTPKGYAILNFDGNRYTVDYKVAGQAKDYRMHIHSPKVVLKHEKTRANFYVNYYMGGDLDSLSYRVNAGPWEALDRVLENDPYFQQIVYAWDNAEALLPGKRPTPPALCSHLWKGMIYGQGQLWSQEVEIRVKDMFGRVFTEKFKYELVVK